MAFPDSRRTMSWAAFVGALLSGAVLLSARGSTAADARSMGLAGAFTAVADEPSALEYNPAGLGRTTAVAGILARTALFSGPTDPLVRQDAVLVRFGTGAHSVGLGLQVLGDRGGVYRETALHLGYAVRVDRRLLVGVQANAHQIGLDPNNPDVAENPYFAERTSVRATTADVGLLGEPANGWTVGLAVQNLLSTDRRFQTTVGDADRLPTQVQVGVAYRLAGIAVAAEQPALRDVLRRSLIAADLGLGDGTRYAVGVELGLSENAAVRVGFRGASGRMKAVTALAAGASLGFSVGALRLWADYGLEIVQADLRDNLTQRLSLRFRY